MLAARRRMMLSTLLAACVLVHADKENDKQPKDKAGAPAAAAKDKKQTAYVPPVGNEMDPRLQAALSAASPVDCDLQACDPAHGAHAAPRARRQAGPGRRAVC